MELCPNLTELNISTDCSSYAKDLIDKQDKEAIFSILLPIVLLICLVSFLLSLSIVCSSWFLKKPLNTTIRLSLSLSAANAAFSLIVFIGTVIHSYLPNVYDVHINKCVQLTIEALRLGIILVQVYHLVVVALVHYFGTLKPLRYNSTVTPKCLKITISAVWIIPIIGIFIGFSSIPDQGFQSEGCQNNYFRQNGVTFRYVWAMLFFCPTLLLVVIYSHIFCILSKRGKDVISEEQRKSMKKNTKTVMTTAMIVGFFIAGWCPAVLAFLIVCDDCLVQIHNIKISIAIFTSAYLMFIFKVLADSFIYVLRLPEIREAMQLSKEYLFHKLGCNTSQGFRGKTRFNSKFSSTFRSTFISSHSSMRDRSFKRQLSTRTDPMKLNTELCPLNGTAREPSTVLPSCEPQNKLCVV